MTPLQRFTALLGEDVFFVPCEWGTKKPLVTYVERPFTGTKSEAYRGIFEVEPTNIAVFLGKASGGLCAIDFDADEDLSAFLAVNPALATTTRSRGSRGGMVWLRVAGGARQPSPGAAAPPSPSPASERYPESCNTKHFEWRADNRISTIYGRHAKGMDYALVVDAAPVALPFADIRWPDGWELPWVGKAGEDAASALADEFGQPFYSNKEGRVTGSLTGFRGTLGTLGTAISKSVWTGVSSQDELGTLGTPILNPHTYVREDERDIHDHTHTYKDFESGVPSVPSPPVEEPRVPAEAMGAELRPRPHLSPSGLLVIPFASDTRYHWWKAGQDPAVTRAEVESWLAAAKGKEAHGAHV